MGFRTWLKRLFAKERCTSKGAGSFPVEALWRSVCNLKQPVILVQGGRLSVLEVTEEANELFGNRSRQELGAMLLGGLDPHTLSRVQLAVVNPVALVTELPIRMQTAGRPVHVSVTVSPLPEYPGDSVALLFFKDTRNHVLPSWARLTRELLSRLPHPAWVTDAAGTVVFSNGSFSEFPIEFTRQEALSVEDFPDQAEFARMTEIQAQLHALPMKTHHGDTLTDNTFDLGPYGCWRMLHIPLKSEDSKEGFVGVLTMRAGTAAPQDDASTEWQRLGGVMGQDALTHVLQVRETERAAVAREIHDSLGQELTVLKLALRRLANLVMSNSTVPDQVPEQFQALRQLVDHLAKSARRIAYELRQDMVQVKGLAHAVQELIIDLRTRLGLQLQLELTANWVEPEGGMAHDMHRCLQEMLNNVSKHARASRCLVRMGFENESYWLEVQDDGVGLTLPKETRSLGLRSLSERAELYGGTVTIKTRPEVEGTLVRLTLPERRQSGGRGQAAAGREANSVGVLA